MTDTDVLISDTAVPTSRWSRPDALVTIVIGAVLFGILLLWGTHAGVVTKGRLITGLPYAMGAISLYLITGLAGQISVAQTAMMGIGAAIAFNLAGAQTGRTPATGQALAFLLALLGAALVGILIAVPALRVRGLHFAIVTLGFAYLCDNVVFSEGNPLGYDPHQTFISRPAFIGTDDKYILWSIIVLAILALLMTNLRRSRFGRGLMAVRDSEVAASVVGINVAKYKVIAFVVASMIAATGGIFYAWYSSNASVALTGGLNTNNGLLLFAFVVMCGMRRVGGAVVAGILFIFMPAILAEKFHSTAYIQLVAGIGLVSLVVLLPDGLTTLTGRVPQLIGSVRRRMSPRAAVQD